MIDEARLAILEARIALLETQRLNATAVDAEAAATLDVCWLLLNGMLVFLMQVGFCMLEAGAVTVKSTESIMIKNMIDCACSALMWWAIGFALAFGDGAASSGFVGWSGQLPFATGVADAHTWAFCTATGTQDLAFPCALLKDLRSSPCAETVFFHLNFCATASTIVSGAIAERAHILAYLLFSSLCSVFIYPVVAHWQWSPNGWASPANPQASLFGGVIDFAGGAAVHVLGGVASLCGAAVIGPRRGRFHAMTAHGAHEHPSDQSEGAHRPSGARVCCCLRRARREALPMMGHSSVLMVMGTFILWVGWYGFNAGSTIGMDFPKATIAARVCVTTALSAAAGGMSAVLLKRFGGRAGAWEVGAMCNGTLAGLVSITSGCATVEPWAAALVGVVGSLLHLAASRAILHCGIDDPLDAAAVHGTGGVVAVLSAALLSTDEYTAAVYGEHLAAGAFYPGGGGERLGVACLFLLATVGWVGSLSTLIFVSLHKLGILRAAERLDNAEFDLDASRVGIAIGHQDVVANIGFEPPASPALPPMQLGSKNEEVTGGAPKPACVRCTVS